ncbi:Sec-independent protein translocase subunit TatA [Sediminivirga luteola]|jgi:sec-independent protein translocase protein TatA|uniref:Sec-independent protein translocase protein TatA n=1 Tax=Sediminivirga luteola TaxID=1774748 RepID=A0A8J2XLH7_9MICO|nr:Sec-independent protein translocase subunit TatA [Sediminivirga luteola]MCI2264055.1 Sec-independent protein translocase subunit TatA [Sediminivirga luteola]GGA22714.1 Sec-independent protein translocase protein TatA [Sediminivirga luteola]
MRPEPIHIIILLIVVLIIFGAPKLPMIAKNIGKSMKIFKSEVKDLRDDNGSTDSEDTRALTDTTPASAEDELGRPGSSQASQPTQQPSQDSAPRRDS